MKEITLGVLFKFYIDVFDKFGLHLLNETDQMLSYYVFQETDVNIGYCSRNILTRFLDEGFIDEDILENSVLLLENFRKLEGRMEIRNAETIRNMSEWKTLMEQADNIKDMIKTRWTDGELQSIFELAIPVNFNI